MIDASKMPEIGGAKSSTKQENDTIWHQNQKIVTRILSFLPPAAWLQLASVNKAWKTLSEDNSLWFSVLRNHSKIELEAGQNYKKYIHVMSKEQARGFNWNVRNKLKFLDPNHQTQFPFIPGIEFTCDDPQDKSLQCTPKALLTRPLLNYFVCVNQIGELPMSFSDGDLHDLTQTNPYLKQITVYGPNKLTHDGLERCILTICNLRILELVRVPVSDGMISQILQKHTTLRVLRLEHSGELTDKTLESIAKYSKHVTDLSLGEGRRSYRDVTFNLFLAAQKQLIRLELNIPGLVDDNCLEMISKTMLSLQNFTCRDSKKVSQRQITKFLSKLRLQRLVLDSCSDSIVKSFAKQKVTGSLKVVWINNKKYENV